MFAAAGIRRQRNRRRSYSDSDKDKAGKNPIGGDGNVMKYFFCKSDKHLKPKCKALKSYKEKLRESEGNKEDPGKGEKDNSVTTKKKEELKKKVITLFSKEAKDDESDSEGFLVTSEEGDQVSKEVGECSVLNCEEREGVVLLAEECNGRAILDTACTDDLAGRKWIEKYINNLSEDDKSSVVRKPGWRKFKFGSGNRMQSEEEIEIPAFIGDQPVRLKTDVLDVNLPLLLSLSTIKRAGAIIDTTEDSAVMAGNKLNLGRTKTGHYFISLLAEDGECSAVMTLENPESWEEALTKLHRQFAHPMKKRLKSLIEAAGQWKAEMDPILAKVVEECKVVRCKMKPFSKPVVAMPRAFKFNDMLTLDLKVRHKKKPILYMIDAATRFTLAEIIEDKHPSSVTEAIVRKWVGGGYGSPSIIHSDGGGEFTGESLVNVAENLNCMVTVTAGRTPFQNGINERGHAVCDRMMEIIREDNPLLDEDLALFWAVNAKNCLQMWNGFSSYQLVFGRNPAIPSNLLNNPPALEGRTISEGFADHLAALHSARQAFMQIESDQKLRKALRHNVRCKDEEKFIGDKVYFKRLGDDRMKGPGTVVGIKGKNLLVKQGAWTFSVRAEDCFKVSGTEVTSEIVKAKTPVNDNKSEDRRLVELQVLEDLTESRKGEDNGDESVEEIDNLENNDVVDQPNNHEENAPVNQHTSTQAPLKVKKDMLVEVKLEDSSWWKGTVVRRT